MEVKEEMKTPNIVVQKSTAFDEAIERWKQQGTDVPIRDVPYSILHLVSRYFPPQGDWKQFAADLGCGSIQTLEEIEGDAHMSGQWPSEVALMYFATTTVKKSPSFADLVTLLHKKLFRLDALHKLYHSGKVDEFLREWKEEDTKVQQQQQHHQQKKDHAKFFARDDHDLIAKLDRMVGNDRLSDVLRSFARRQTHKSPLSAAFEQNFSAALTTTSAMSKCATQLSPVREYTVNACPFIEVPRRDHVHNPDDLRALSTVKPESCILSQPTVLLTYSSDVENLLPELVSRFRSNGICVVAEYVLRGKGVLEINPIAAWQSLFMQCHFVIPIVSNDYLRDIVRPSETDQSQAVRFVYDLYTGKYVSDGCRNHIVRPLVVDVQPRLLRNVNPTLRMRWRLWEDLDKLFALIREGYEARVRRL